MAGAVTDRRFIDRGDGLLEASWPQPTSADYARVATWLATLQRADPSQRLAACREYALALSKALAPRRCRSCLVEVRDHVCPSCLAPCRGS